MPKAIIKNVKSGIVFINGYESILLFKKVFLLVK